MSEEQPRRDDSLSTARGAEMHREKVVSRGLAGAMFGGFAFFSIGGIVGYFADPNAPLWALLLVQLFALAFLATALVKPVLRTTVTDQEVYAQQGLREWRVALDQITKVSVVPANKQALSGAEAVGPMFGATATLIEYRDASGANKKLALASNDAAALVATIEVVKSGAASTGVRVDGGDVGVGADVAESAVEAASKSATRSA
ncbi:MAG: hypothetical protein JNK05_06425 [Myxococcales bacterium]|nr:hypothetical protein [Myxococcales bacterium]